MFEKEVSKGWLEGPYTLQEARRRYPGLRVAASGAIAKDLDGGIRVIYDATHHVRINHHIQRNQPTK